MKYSLHLIILILLTVLSCNEKQKNTSNQTQIELNKTNKPIEIKVSKEGLNSTAQDTIKSLNSQDLIAKDGLEIKLVKENLSIVQGYFSSNSKIFFYESGEEIKVDSLLNFEIITEKEFNQLKNNNINHINLDSTNVHRIGDSLFIKNLKFVDNNSDSDDYVKHKYVGSFDFLNKYIISRNLWENGDFILVNKSNGKIDSENSNLIHLAQDKGMNRLGFPRVSINKINMISLQSSIYSGQAELNIFKINNSKLQLELSLLFKNWSPIENQIYWTSDTTFIVQALPIKLLDEYEEVDFNPEYLKITIK